MIECACYCDGDSYGAFDRSDLCISREYLKCCECGETIWPWEKHTIGTWWDCEDCEEFEEFYLVGGTCEGDNDDCEADDCTDCPHWAETESCEDSACDGWCHKGLDPTSVNHMCNTCANVVDALLCGCWWVGRVWEQVADHNEMTVKECLGKEGSQ